MPTKGKLGPLLRKAKSEGWADRIQSCYDEAAVLEGCVFNQAKADYVVEFFRTFLRHSKGRKWSGQPFELEPWQRQDIIEPIFGWIKPDGFRRITVAFVEIPKKNGKSTLCAGVCLYMLVGDGEPGAEVYSAATSKDQASLVHGEAINMVEASPSLMKSLHINHSSRVISHKASRSKYATLPYEKRATQGQNIHCLGCDELHVWRGHDVWDSLEHGFANRDQPLHFITTTAGEYDKTTVGWEQHQFGEEFLKGELPVKGALNYLAFIRGAAHDADWTDPAVHKAANPNYGVTVSAEELADKADKAKRRPTALNSFKRYRLNMWVESSHQLIDMFAWDECKGEIDLAALKGQECYGGLDMSTVKDLTAFVLLFPPVGGRSRWVLLPRAWIPREGAERRQHDDQVPYLTWSQTTCLTLTDGVQVDLEAVAAQVQQDKADYNLAEVAYDGWGTAEAVRQMCDYNAEYWVKFEQSIKPYTAPTKGFVDGLIPAGELLHDGDAITRWCAGNLAGYDDGNENIRPSKKSSRERIDIMVAAIMAYARARLRTEARDPTFTII